MSELTLWLHWLSWPLLLAGTFFFLAGTVGLLRFPDVYSRLHAVTKADTLGFGLLVAGLCLRSDNGYSMGVMVLVWLLIMASGATACQLLSRYQREADADADAAISASTPVEEKSPHGG